MKKGEKMPDYIKKKLSEKAKKRVGSKNGFYGKHHSVKTREILRSYHLGRIASIETRNKMRIAQTGRKQSESTKRKLSEQRLGIPRPKHVRDALLKANIGRKISEETRKRLSLAGKGRPKTYEWKKMMSERRKGWKIPFYDTKPERMMQLSLSLNGIKYEKHKRIDLNNGYHHVDIFIEPNIIVEVDGIYWHLKPERIIHDLRQTQELTLMGYHIIRIRDKDILTNANNCAETIINLIKQIQIKLIKV